ncbi:phosphatase PAP2 family protein [Chromatium okenii]|uniref:phosphatase PAP2 family protein n=1 Tax=Chromatium okenii TaxID=61644 RepID=UPI0026EBEAA6|nr:phosphatase PAP2 family protein [Chromatium okenii]MBV5310358.1 phosphatase PAP2 family protein [Chromatium okenii]
MNHVRAWQTQLAATLAATPPSTLPGARWLLGFALVCASAAVSLWLGDGYHAGFLTLNHWAASYPAWCWQWLTVLGDERVAVTLTLLFSWRYPRLVWSLVLAALLGALYSRGLKELVDAARPPAVFASDAFNLIGSIHRRASFPSGHSVTAAVLCGVFIAHARLSEWRILLLLIAILIGMSRIAVGVHWPVDVAAGLLGGTLAAWLGCWLAQRWPQPAGWLAVQMSVTGIATLCAINLFLNDGGYPESAPFLHFIALSALIGGFSQFFAFSKR